MSGFKSQTYTVINIDTGWIGNLPGTYKLRPNLQVYEIACSDGSDIVLYSDITADWFQAIRDIVGPVSVSSGHRTYTYNKSPKVGGATNSFHVLGRAMDLRCPKGMKLIDFYKVVEKVCGYRSGLKYYVKDNFVHMDSRKGHWRGN